MNYTIISVRNNPTMLNRAVDYFHNIWGIARQIYDDCISHSLTTPSKIPRWYLMMNDDEIIGSYGLIANDFISRQDLYPYLCALHINKDYRGKALGSVLLKHGQKQAKKLGFDKLYLCTDHVGYYEKYGWHYIGNGYTVSGEPTRLYETKTSV